MDSASGTPGGDARPAPTAEPRADDTPEAQRTEARTGATDRKPGIFRAEPPKMAAAAAPGIFRSRAPELTPDPAQPAEDMPAPAPDAPGLAEAPATPPTEGAGAAPAPEPSTPDRAPPETKAPAADAAPARPKIFGSRAPSLLPPKPASGPTIHPPDSAAEAGGTGEGARPQLGTLPPEPPGRPRLKAGRLPPAAPKTRLGAATPEAPAAKAPAAKPPAPPASAADQPAPEQATGSAPDQGAGKAVETPAAGADKPAKPRGGLLSSLFGGRSSKPAPEPQAAPPEPAPQPASPDAPPPAAPGPASDDIPPMPVHRRPSDPVPTAEAKAARPAAPSTPEQPAAKAPKPAPRPPAGRNMPPRVTFGAGAIDTPEDETPAAEDPAPTTGDPIPPMPTYRRPGAAAPDTAPAEPAAKTPRARRDPSTPRELRPIPPREKPAETRHMPLPGPGSEFRVIALPRLSQGGRWRTEAMRAYAAPMLLWFTRGQGRITVAGVTRGYGSHNAVYMPAGTMHGFDMTGQVYGSAVFFPTGTNLILPEEPVHLRFRDAIDQNELTQLIENIQREIDRKLPIADRALEHHAGLLSVWLERQMLTQQALAEPAEPAARQLSAAYAALVEKEFRSGRGVADYAAELGVTPTHLTRSCNAACGRSAHDVLTDRIFYEARKLLHDSARPVKEISEELGFTSPAYFTRAFQKATGETPTAFRKHP